MKKFLLLSFSIFFICTTAQPIPFEKADSYNTGLFNMEGVESMVYDRNSQRIFFTNRNNTSLNIISLADIHDIKRTKTIDLTSYINKVNAVAAHLGIIAVLGESPIPQFNGKVLFFDKDGMYLNQLTVGPKPKMLAFSPNGSFLLIANEGDPSDDYSSDPEGSVSIINMGPGPQNLSNNDLSTVSLDTLNNQNIDPLINIYGNNAQQTVAQDLEPEFIAINPSSTKAYVSLQENNALMIIDIFTAGIDTIFGFGYLDRSISGNGLDPSSSAQSVNIDTYTRLYGMFQPQGMSSFSANGNVYLATANKGAAREYTAYNEVQRINSVPLHPGKFDPANIQQNDSLGLLKISTSLGDMDGDGLYDSLFTFGTRSFSIRDENGQLIWDSGDDFEQIIAQAYPAAFNSDYDDNNSYKSRSDDMGPEPVSVATGMVDGILYAFIALERMGGVMIYDISDPSNPQFVQYELNRDFSISADSSAAGDLGTREIQFVPANQSPSGLALLISANAVSGNVSIYEMGQGVGTDEYRIEKLNIYPNPTADKVRISRNGNFRLYDSKGQLIKVLKNSSEIDLQSEKAGFYILKSNEGEVIKIIKN